MSIFSRVRTEHASDLSNEAMMRGLEHLVLPSAGAWTTFQFTNENCKESFDRMVSQQGHRLWDPTDTKSLIDQVAKGVSVKQVLGEAINEAKLKCPQCGSKEYTSAGPGEYECDKCGAVFSEKGKLLKKGK